jgi:hypothetical protein
MAEEVARSAALDHGSAELTGSTIKVRPRTSTTRIAEPTGIVPLSHTNSAFQSSDPSLT